MSNDHHDTAPQYEDSCIPQPYHLVKPSPWPLLGALAAGLMMGGTVMFMHKAAIHLGGISIDLGWKAPMIGLVGVIAIMFVWWRDIIHESIVEKAHSPVTQIGLRYGMALFIASEVMFFAAFFWAYYSAALYPGDAIGHVWPPANIKTFDPLDMPSIMTLILLLSGTTVTWAHHAVLEGDREGLIQGLACTVALG
ncbi:MAG: cytochrome c oxidase subunit 3, partial [Pseudomonadota bacterium]|nr:cytochrome c oxidase subunit 3 [Pseudomonadota bacterium]